MAKSDSKAFHCNNFKHGGGPQKVRKREAKKKEETLMKENARREKAKGKWKNQFKKPSGDESEDDSI